MVSASANPKSSTGRLDVFTRVIGDRARGFDQMPAGYSGPLYVEISPRTFPILVRTGSRLSQMRFRCGDNRLTVAEHQALHASDTLVFDNDVPVGDGVALSIDLKGVGRNGPVSAPSGTPRWSMSTGRPRSMCTTSGNRCIIAAAKN